MFDVENPRAVIGDNHPPVELTPFDLSKTEIEDLYSEAKNWLDGAPVETQGQADDIAKLIAALREAKKTADERRVEENKPFDEGKAAVQARYNPLIQKDKGKVDLAIAVCKQALAPFLAKQEAEQRAAAEAARIAAETKQREALDAMQAARASADLEQRERAETLVVEAKRAAKVATKAENTKAQAKGGGARAMSLRTTYRAEIIDQTEFAKHVWQNHRLDMTEFLTDLADKLVAAGSRSIPGVNIIEDKVAV